MVKLLTLIDRTGQLRHILYIRGVSKNDKVWGLKGNTEEFTYKGTQAEAVPATVNGELILFKPLGDWEGKCQHRTVSQETCHLSLLFVRCSIFANNN